MGYLKGPNDSHKIIVKIPIKETLLVWTNAWKK